MLSRDFPAPAAPRARPRARRFMLLAGCAILLGACSGGPPKRVFPPSLSVQQLERAADGGWQLTLRLQNFSTVAMRFDRIDARLELQGTEAARIDAAPGLMVPPNGAEPWTLRVTPTATAATALDAALAGGGSVSYRVSGEIESREPDRRRDEFEFSSALSPVPGLSGVLR